MTEVVAKVHARLGASNAHRWSRCPGSVVLEEGQPDNAGRHAKWGTAAHELASIMLEPLAGEIDRGKITAISGLNAEAYMGRVFTVEGDEFEVDQDMATCINDYIQSVVDFLDPGDILLVEQALPIAHITGEKDAEGTGDVIVIKPTKAEIVVIDLKTGKGVQVDADGNEQCAMYAGGAIEAYDMFYGPFEHVTNVIIQPRIEHVSEERITIEELYERLEKLTVWAGACDVAIETAAQGGIIKLVPGEKQCRFCKAKAVCPALEGAVSGALGATATRDDFPDLTLPKQAAAATGDLEQVTTDRLSAAMRAADLVETWLKAVRAEVERRLFAGQEVPGFKVVQGKKGNRAWTDPDKAEEALKAARLKVDEMYDKKLKTPPVLEKALKGKPKVWAKLAPLIGQSEGKPSVAPESDPRPAYSVAAEANDFPDLDGEGVDPFS